MITSINTRTYNLFGFNVYSEVQIKEAINIKCNSELIDITITIKDLNEQWQEHQDPYKRFVAKTNLVMFCVKDIAIFSIEKGNKIIISPLQNYCEDKVRLYILGTCMGAILIQNHILPLHGSAIEINGNAYAIIGDSGAGKTTTASYLLMNGFKLMSDDVIPIKFNENQEPLVIPSYPQQKIWKETLEMLNLETENYIPLFERERKYSVRVDSEFCPYPRKLKGIFELVRSNTDRIHFQKKEGLSRFPMLFTHTYRNFLVKRLNLMDWHFIESSRILRKVDTYNISRPEIGNTIPELMSYLMNSIEEGVESSHVDNRRDSITS